MAMRTLSRLVRAVLCLSFVMPVWAHDGDRKLLDKELPYFGPGWTPGNGPEGPQFAASGVALHAWLSLNDLATLAGLPINFPSDNGNSCWGYVSPSGREYAIMGLHRGTIFIEITDPQNPTYVGFVDGPDSLWRDMKTFQDHCYAISEGGSGIQIISMANIDGVTNRIQHVGNITTGGTAATHTLFINEATGRLYRCGGGSNGLRIYTLVPATGFPAASKTNPGFMGSWTDRYVHECQVLSYTTGPYAGKEIVFACSENGPPYSNPGLDILDVTSVGSIVNLYPPRVTWPSGAFSHQIWVSPDRRYGYINDELDESNFGIACRTVIVDLRFLVDGAFTTPSVAGFYQNGNPSVDHNLYVNGNLILASNYRSGLRIFCVDDPLAPAEIGFFDTYPANDSPNFNGLWNNYSFFPSGTVIGSDIERGLFIWDITGVTTTLAIAYPQGRPSTVAPAGGTTMQVSIAPPSACGSAIVAPGTALLHVNSGSGWTSTPLAALGGSLYQATFPPTPCSANVSYYVSVENTLGAQFNDPVDAPGTVHSAISANGFNVVANHDFEVAAGWTVGDPGSPDNATTGLWQRADPEATGAQPGDDHSPPPGTLCWVTGPLAGTGVGSHDVDGGKTTLMSPTFNTTGMADPRITYWRWYSNTAGSAPNADIFVIDISNNNGASWVNAETVGPTGPQTSGGWFQHTFRIADFVTPTAQIKLRFVASDFGDGSIVEALIDDFQLYDLDCAVVCTKADVNNDGDVNGIDIGFFAEEMISGGTPGSVPFCASDVNNNGQLELGVDLPAFVACVLNGGCP